MDTRMILSTRDMTRCALMAVMIAVCSWISIPIGPVPFTLQTLGVFCALWMLGGMRGMISKVLYQLLGAVGVPGRGAGLVRIPVHTARRCQDSDGAAAQQEDTRACAYVNAMHRASTPPRPPTAHQTGDARPAPGKMHSSSRMYTAHAAWHAMMRTT